MKERMSPIAQAAERCGVHPQTMKQWIRKLGYNLPPRQGKGRYTILVPDWMIEKVIAERSPRIPRVRGG
jgi:transposase-like protein